MTYRGYSNEVIYQDGTHVPLNRHEVILTSSINHERRSHGFDHQRILREQTVLRKRLVDRSFAIFANQYSDTIPPQTPKISLATISERVDD